MKIFGIIICLFVFTLSYQIVHAQQPLEQDSDVIFELIESIKFADGTEVKSIAKDDIESLRDRPVRLGENDGIDGVTLSKRKVGKQIGVSELERVYGQLKNNEATAEASGEQAERVNDNHQNLPMNGNEPTTLSQ